MTEISDNNDTHLPPHSPMIAVVEDDRVRARMEEIKAKNGSEDAVTRFRTALDDVFFNE